MSLLYFWNTWDKIITFLMSLLILTSVSILSWFVLIDFAPLLWVIFSFFFPHLLILPCWLLEMLVFTQTSLGFVRDLRSFWVLLLRFKNQSSAHTRANYFHYWGKTFLALYPKPYKLWGFSVWLAGLTALCECQVLSLILLESSFPASQQFPHTQALIITLSDTLWGRSAGLWSSFSV